MSTEDIAALQSSIDRSAARREALLSATRASHLMREAAGILERIAPSECVRGAAQKLVDACDQLGGYAP